MCNGGDGYIWGFEHAGNANGNASGNASINWIKINIDDLSFTEGTWEISGQLYNFGVYDRGDISLWSYRPNTQANSVVCEGYLYCFNKALTGVYKINLVNPTDITFLEHPNKAIALYNKSGSGSYYSFDSFSANIVIAANKVCLWDSWLNGDSFVMNMFAVGTANEFDELSDGWYSSNTSGHFRYYPFRNSCGTQGVEIGVFSLHVSAVKYEHDETATVHANLLLNSPYLATINNLTTPVQKTADKTMKITYILREETA